jgi:hypothetical protein
VNTSVIQIRDQDGVVRMIMTAAENRPLITMYEDDGRPAMEVGRPSSQGGWGIRLIGPAGKELAYFLVDQTQFGDRSQLSLGSSTGASVHATAAPDGSLLQVYTGSVEQGRGVQMSADSDNVLMQLSDGPGQSGVTVSAEDDKVGLIYWTDHMNGRELIRLIRQKDGEGPWLEVRDPQGKRILSR